jgi:CRISPR-associated exonuclease Cas4
MTWLFTPLALILLLAAGVVLFVAKRQQRSSGLPAGRIISSDTSDWDKVERPLYDPISGLTGKPDYLVALADGETLVPVEVKSGRAPTVPFDSHVFQLAAYCLLVERAYGQRPPYGILRYRDRTFSIEFTPALEEELEDALAEIRQQEKRGEASRSHNEPARCARCGYRKICEQRL